MKVTITADTGEQDIEITREGRDHSDPTIAKHALSSLLDAGAHDVRRAAGLPAEHEPGAILAAWRQIVRLTGCDDPLPLSPASVVDRVAVLVETETHALNAKAAEAAGVPT